MEDLNRYMQYETVMDKYWPTNSDHNTKLDDQYAPITRIMIDMKDVFGIVKPDTAQSDSVVDNINYNKQIKYTESLIDIDSFWRF